MTTMESTPQPPHPAKRKHYSVFMKLRAVEYAEVHGNMAAQRALGVFESSIRTWRNQKDELAKLSPNRSTLRHGTSKHPELDHKLREWVLSQHHKGVPVTTISLRFKALSFAQQLSLQFRPGTSWAHRFLRRSGMQLRKGEKGVNTVDISPEDLPATSRITVTAKNPSDPTDDSCNGSAGEMKSKGGSKFDLHRKFRKCERRILGTTTDFVDPPRPLCKLCGQPFELEGTPSQAQSSIGNLCVCEVCTGKLRQLLQPQERDSRLAALEAEVATLRGWLTRLDPDGDETCAVTTRQNVRTVPVGNGPRGRVARQRNKIVRSPSTKVRQITTKKISTPKKRITVKTRIQSRVADRRSKSTLTNVSSKDARETTTPTVKQVAVFNCFFCDLSFRSRQQLHQHEDSEHNRRKNHFVCPSCPQQFTSQSTLQRHLKQHPSTTYREMENAGGGTDSLLQCSFCSETFVMANALKEHLNHYHPDSGRRKRCRRCGKRIANAGNLRSHESKCVGSTVDDEDEQQTALPVECEVGDADGSDAVQYLELAALLEQGDGVGCEGEISENGGSPTMVARLNRLAGPGMNEEGVSVKLEPPGEDMVVVD